ncbi:DUF2795 domain-containing protein [Candidatus Nitrosocosmicus franklandus]|uniref:DUF2795 domain-containing protein n=1 Tax=Candidatus Nitrosocosmicus franklandianus TaxID=1798806 RepID=A0A484IGK8_9ARCH|nr:DUF2795 domain-containing protein [Candidatus Nitrosocosmicus franklandus]VFJ15152.1 conserved protein of unknown function [Candidatus Nitrosocosmicus franklandus]
MNQSKKEQIPESQGPESQTGKIINQQNVTEGQRKEVNVESYSGVSKLADILKDVSFPAPKSKILDYVVQSEDFDEKDSIISALNKLKDRTYNGVSDLTSSAGLVYR